ncbi:hypothetical protein VII00023_11069, partial [Vibrio ichthyoenteri ATCC 700023]
MYRILPAMVFVVIAMLSATQSQAIIRFEPPLLTVKTSHSGVESNAWHKVAGYFAHTKRDLVNLPLSWWLGDTVSVNKPRINLTPQVRQSAAKLPELRSSSVTV